MWPQALLGNAAQCLKWHISATAPSGLLEQRKSTYHEVWTRCWLRSHSNTWRYITIIWKIWVIELLTSIWRATCLFQRDIHEASVILFQGLKHSTWSVCTIPSVYPHSFCTSSDLLSPSILLLSQVLSSPGNCFRDFADWFCSPTHLTNPFSCSLGEKAARCNQQWQCLQRTDLTLCHGLFSSKGFSFGLEGKHGCREEE